MPTLKSKPTTVAEVISKSNPTDRYAKQNHATVQTIPTTAQILAKGGGVGGYLRAWRELNG